MAMPNAKRRWTIEEFRALPDDGNKYEFIHGEVFVTPAPSREHGNILSRLAAILVPYVLEEGIGFVHFPRDAFTVRDEVEVEPDLTVIPEATEAATDRTPILVAEVASPSTRKYDRTTKRDAYLSNSISEYWIVDGASRSVSIIRPGRDDLTVTGTVIWTPVGASEALSFPVSKLFEPWGLRRA